MITANLIKPKWIKIIEYDLDSKKKTNLFKLVILRLLGLHHDIVQVRAKMLTH